MKVLTPHPTLCPVCHEPYQGGAESYIDANDGQERFACADRFACLDAFSRLPEQREWIKRWLARVR